ncbi:hypothetical protein MMC18_009545 [Xylographa bjoerkii]|nr:hypothetical protein [Xylographa bjoerkii]
MGGYVVSILSLRLWGPKAPLVGIRFLFEPRIIGNYRFFKNAASVINEGYAKYKSRPYKFVRNDADMVVIPNQFIDEVQALPNHIANPTSADAHNLLWPYTDIGVILRSNLHFRVIQTKLTPNLGSLTEPMQEELDHALVQEFPGCKDWVIIEPYHLILKLVARISARVFLGLPVCRDPQWLEISTQFTENVFITVCLLRLFPTWTHPLLSKLLPSRWRGYSYVQRAKKLLVPEILRRREAWSKDETAAEEHWNLLSWMMECGTEAEIDPTHLAHLEIVISLASIHTSQMNAVHVIYDLAAHPEYIQALRDEIRQVWEEGGGLKKTYFVKLRRLDSFLKESQRFNPPSLLSFHRVMQQDHVLESGMLLPRNSHICMAVNAIQNNPEITPDPKTFDGWRYYQLRQELGESHKHQSAMTESTLLNFGHGKYACPGRFFASLEIKIILTRLIMNYDFKLVDGKRPINLTAHEFIFPNPDAKLFMKERAAEDQLAF